MINCLLLTGSRAFNWSLNTSYSFYKCASLLCASRLWIPDLPTNLITQTTERDLVFHSFFCEKYTQLSTTHIHTHTQFIWAPDITKNHSLFPRPTDMLLSTGLAGNWFMTGCPVWPGNLFCCSHNKIRICSADRR